MLLVGGAPVSSDPIALTVAQPTNDIALIKTITRATISSRRKLFIGFDYGASLFLMRMPVADEMGHTGRTLCCVACFPAPAYALSPRVGHAQSPNRSSLLPNESCAAPG
jgi:hypothetical protein